MENILSRNILFILFHLFGTFITFGQAGRIFNSVETTAENFLQNNNQASINNDREMGAFIYQNDQGYFHGPTAIGGPHKITGDQLLNSGALDLSLGSIHGFAHTHGKDSGTGFYDNQLSDGDVNTSVSWGFPIYGGFPNGSGDKFDPNTGATEYNFNVDPLPYDTNSYSEPAGNYYNPPSDYREH